METYRYKASVQYDGTDFFGFQIQPEDRTVQAVLEEAIAKVGQADSPRLVGAGRTDSGVHARGQVIHFDLAKRMPERSLLMGLNACLPADVAVTNVESVAGDFHARYDAKDKTYLYQIYNGPVRDPFLARYAYHHRYQLDAEKLEAGLKLFQGQHDFQAFASSKAEVKSFVRTIYQTDLTYDPGLNLYGLRFRGDGFLYNQIRIMVGTLLQVADGRRPVTDIEKILASKDRNLAGPTAAPQGLIMESVGY